LSIGDIRASNRALCPDQHYSPATTIIMSRPAPINTQSSNTLDRLKKKVVNFLSPIKSGFSPTSPRKSQKPLPPFEPQTQPPSVAIRPVEPSLRPSASRNSLHPADDLARIRTADLLPETLGDHATDLHLEVFRLLVVHLPLKDRLTLSTLDVRSALDAPSTLDIRVTTPMTIMTIEIST